MSNQRKIIEIPARITEAQARTEKLCVAAYCRVFTNQKAQQNSYQTQRAYYLDKIRSLPIFLRTRRFPEPPWTTAQSFSG